MARRGELTCAGRALVTRRRLVGRGRVSVRHAPLSGLLPLGVQPRGELGELAHVALEPRALVRSSQRLQLWLDRLDLGELALELLAYAASRSWEFVIRHPELRGAHVLARGGDVSVFELILCAREQPEDLTGRQDSGHVRVHRRDLRVVSRRARVIRHDIDRVPLSHRLGGVATEVDSHANQRDQDEQEDAKLGDAA